VPNSCFPILKSVRIAVPGLTGSELFRARNTKGMNISGSGINITSQKSTMQLPNPLEEFRTNDSGLGYEEAKPGDAFVRIGIGTVRKLEEKAYRPYDSYDIVEPGKWRIRRHKDRIEFSHQLRADDGYAYLYRETVRLVKGKPELLIEHSLRNTGSKVIETTPHNHNCLSSITKL
jgi:hypothetical protein